MENNRRVAGVRGLRRIDTHRCKMKFSDYIEPSLLPPLPPSPTPFGHVMNTMPFGQWGMLGNDQCGDCVIAGGMHETMIWKNTVGGPTAVPRFDTASAFRNYSAALVDQGGQPYDPSDDNTDTGLDMVQALLWRMRTGLTDANGGVHKVDAVVSLNNDAEVLHCIYYFGAVPLGFSLPDNAEDFFEQGKPWSDTSQQPGDGHYVPAVGFNSEGNFVVVTWNDLQAVTPAFMNKYCNGRLGVLSKEYMLAKGLSPEGIDWNRLSADIARMPTA